MEHNNSSAIHGKREISDDLRSSAEDKELAQQQNEVAKKEKRISSPRQHDVHTREWISNPKQYDNYEHEKLAEQNLERHQQNSSTQEIHSIPVKLIAKAESKEHVESSQQQNYHRIMHQRKLYNSETNFTIEACSGRKLEDVEVLKQKYINSEIQDLPSTKSTPFRSGRFVRNKSTHVKVDSQDIRCQVNKLRMKTGSSVSDPAVDTLQNIRCKGIKKSAEFILNNDPFNPDYNPELASLYEHYIKKCDNMTRQRVEAKNLLRDLMRTGRDDSNDKSSDRLESDTQEAYLCGFLEGMQRNLNKPSCYASIQGRELVEEAEVHSLCSHSTSFREFISRKQDITHRPLREWEHQLRREQQRSDFLKRHTGNAICSYCEQESKRREHMKTNNLQEKPINGVDIDHVTDVHAYSTFQSPTLPSLMKEQRNELKYNAVDLSKLSKEDLDIVKMAKKKLEHKMLPSLEMEEMFLNRLKHKDFQNKIPSSNNSSLKRKSIKNKCKSGEAAEGSYIQFTTLDNFEGWETKTKHFNDPDNLNVELSERLHPVDSNCETFHAQLWAPLNSTPLMTPADRKVLSTATPKEEKLQKDSMEIAEKDKLISLPDLNDPKPSARKQKPVNSQQGLSTEFKKAADIVKLRLTNSSNVVEKNPDGVTANRALVNVPHARCVSYNFERHLQASTQLAPRINLTENLAQHLKEMGQNPKVRDCKKRNNPLSSITPRLTLTKSSTVDVGSTAISCSSKTITCNTPDPSFAIQTGNTHVLPDINSQSDRGENRNTPKVPKQIRKYASVDKITYPPLSVRSLASTEPDETALKFANQSESDKSIFQCEGGKGVRISNCTSSYMFDKKDPQTLQLTTRSLPLLYKVCTGCGRISAGYIDSDAGERRGIVNNGERNSELGRRQTNPSCCELCTVDDKWKLDKHIFKQHPCTPEINYTERLMDTNQISNVIPDTLKQTPPRDMQSNLNPTQCKELSISFMDQNIKLRIQCELTVENTNSLGNGGRGESRCNSEGNGCEGGKDVMPEKQESNIHQQGEKWLERIAKPKNKGRLGCPVISETRIYRDNLKNLNKTETSPAQHSPRLPVHTPYVEYCKHKAELQTKRINQILQNSAAKLSDTASNDDVYKKSISRKSKKLPVIRKKKSKQSRKGESCGKNERRKMFR